MSSDTLHTPLCPLSHRHVGRAAADVWCIAGRDVRRRGAARLRCPRCCRTGAMRGGGGGKGNEQAMKSVMLSIRPEWCALIASGRKTIEVRDDRTDGCTDDRPKDYYAISQAMGFSTR